jgi:hypothetical protein
MLVLRCSDTISAHIEAIVVVRVPNPVVAEFPPEMSKCRIGRLRIGGKAPDTVVMGRTRLRICDVTSKFLVTYGWRKQQARYWSGCVERHVSNW